MTDTEDRKKYFYDFGDKEDYQNEELPENIEEFNKRVEAKKKEILQKRAGTNKIQQVRHILARGKQ